MTVPTVNARHIYDVPEVYDTIYYRTKGYKTDEAAIFAYIMQREKPDAKEFVEFFSGENSKHRQQFLDEYAFSDGATYFGTDGARIEDNGGVGYSDTTIYTDDLVAADLGREFDAVLGYFFSLQCVVDFNTGYVTRERTVQMLKNALRHLKPGGLLLMDSHADGFNTATKATYLDYTRRWVDYNSHLSRLLREKYGYDIKPTDDIEMVSDVDHWYDRTNGNSVDLFKDVVVVRGDEELLRYKIELPMCVRYFSEPEIRDMLIEAGFKRVDLWFADYQEFNVFKIAPKLEWDEDVVEEAREHELGNVYCAFRD